jgi:polar amino acid transport system substrate-binding protein
LKIKSRQRPTSPNLSPMHTRTLCLVLITALLVAGCGSSDADNDLRFNENSRMYDIQQKGVLRVAVPDTPPFGSPDATEGFAADLGRQIAEDLEVEAEIVTADSFEMGQLAAYRIVDVGFPLMPVTYGALRVHAPSAGYAFASPYFIAHQRLLVPEDSGVEQLADLEGERICSYINERTQVDVSRLVDADVTQASTLDECRRALKAGKADAVTAVDSLLASLQISLKGTGDYAIVGDELNTEGYAAVTLPGGMATYIIGELNDIEEEGIWLELYNKWLEPYLGPVPGPPNLTLQDAASLYPPEPSEITP